MRIQLCNRFVQNQYFRFQRYYARQRKQMGLPSGKLPDILIFSTFQPALRQCFRSPLFIIRHGIIHAGIGSIVQHSRPDDLIFEILIDISHFSCQSSDV